jgi:acyl-CoA reductase-like NAD-dependent aldehyde dehydrogenase
MGRWSQIEDFQNLRSGTGEAIAEVYETSAADVDRAVQAAKRAFESKIGLQKKLLFLLSALCIWWKSQNFRSAPIRL